MPLNLVVYRGVSFSCRIEQSRGAPAPTALPTWMAPSPYQSLVPSILTIHLLRSIVPGAHRVKVALGDAGWHPVYRTMNANESKTISPRPRLTQWTPAQATAIFEVLDEFREWVWRSDGNRSANLGDEDGHF